MDDAWAKTLSEEYGFEVKDNSDAEETDTSTAEEDTSAEGAVGEGDSSAEGGEPDATVEDDSESESDEESEETAEEPGDGESEEAPRVEEPPAKDEPEEKFAPKEAIKEALREMEAETRQGAEIKSKLKDAVIERLYPEGVDRQLRDADGDPINGIDDLTKLINPKTDDYFTEDEAGAWLLSAQQKLNGDIEKMEQYAEQIVEVDMSLRDGANRVEEVYGDFFKEHPEIYDSLTKQYDATIVRDENTGLILKTPVDIEQFFNTALGGYIQQQQAQKQQAEAQAKAEAAAKAKQQKAAQHERADLSRLGSTENLSKEEKGWADAMSEYYNS